MANLIEIVAEEIIRRFSEKKDQRKVVVTSRNVCPVEAKAGNVKNRTDLESNYDEAHYLIPQQVDAAIRGGKKSIRIHSSDTDVFRGVARNDRQVRQISTVSANYEQTR